MTSTGGCQLSPRAGADGQLEELPVQPLGAIDQLTSPGPHESSWIDRGHETSPRGRRETPRHGWLCGARLTVNSNYSAQVSL
jgi:hypothetical protein